MIKIKKRKNKKLSIISKSELEKQIISAEKLMKNRSATNNYLAEKKLLNTLKHTNNIEHLYYNTIINNHLGIIYARRGNYLKSMFRFSSILIFDPDNKSVNNNLIKISKKFLDNSYQDKQLLNDVKTDYAHAKEFFTEKNYDKLEPIAFRLIHDYDITESTSVWISYSHCFMGAVVSKQDRYKDAIIHYIDALKLNKNNV